MHLLIDPNIVKLMVEILGTLNKSSVSGEKSSKDIFREMGGKDDHLVNL